MARLLRALIRRFDAYLCRIYGVYEFTQDPECILRISKITAVYAYIANGITIIPAGEPVLEIHLWNEHMTPLSASESSMVWTGRILRKFKYSLKLIARQMGSDPDLAAVRGIVAVTSVLSSESNPDRPDFMQRLGFITGPYTSRLGAFGEFWENFYAWWMMWTYNPLSLRSRHLLGIHRTEMWMPIAVFKQRYS